jgi:hypothetical protein
MNLDRKISAVDIVSEKKIASIFRMSSDLRFECEGSKEKDILPQKASLDRSIVHGYRRRLKH